MWSEVLFPRVYLSVEDVPLRLGFRYQNLRQVTLTIYSGLNNLVVDMRKLVLFSV